MRFSVLSMILVWGCGDDATGTDAGRGMDAGGRDGGRDGGSRDGASADGGGADDGGRDAGGSQDAGASIDGSTCPEIVARATAFLAASKECSTAADCITVAGGCYPEHEGCCVVYMNTTHDSTRWRAYLDALDVCFDGPCACCAAIPPEPDCIEGRCGPRR